MRSISERDLAVVIKLLAARVHGLRESLLASESKLDELSEEEIETRCDDQEQLASYDATMRHLRKEYEEALADGFALPSFERLTTPADED